MIEKKNNWVFTTNYDFLISLQPDAEDFRYFKLINLQLDQTIKVGDIKGSLHHAAKIWGFRNLSLLERHNYFVSSNARGWGTHVTVVGRNLKCLNKSFFFINWASKNGLKLIFKKSQKIGYIKS